MTLNAVAAQPDASPTLSVGWFQKTFGNLTWAEAISCVTSPRSASAQVRRHIRYQEDLGDEWTSGPKAWERGHGDCEDFAAAVVALVQGVGLKAEIMVLAPVNSMEAHAVAVGQHEGRIWFSSNGWYQTADSMDEVKRVVARDLGWPRRQAVEIIPVENFVARAGKTLDVAAK